MALDFEALLRPIDDESPSGEELRYDPAFQALQTEVEPKTDYKMVDGQEVAVTAPRDWEKLRRDALALCGKGRDLRLIVLLLRTLVGVDGVAGAGAGLHLFRASLEQHWATLHPQLDTDETEPAEQATLRLNAVRQLADPSGLLDELRRASIVGARGLGGVSLRDIEIAEGRLQPTPGEDHRDAAMVEAIFKSAEAEAIEHAHNALTGAIGDVKAIDGFLTEQIGRADLVPDLSPLQDMLETLAGQVSSRVQVELADNEVDSEAGDAEPSSAPSGGKAKATALGRIETREDVQRTLDRLLDYYARREPSSPIPLLLERVKRLVPMSFLELMRDLAPDGVDQMKAVGGVVEEDEY